MGALTSLSERNISGLRCRLLEKRTSLADSSLEAIGYYYEIRHDGDRKFTAIRYLGRNHDHSERQYVRLTDNLEAAKVADLARE